MNHDSSSPRAASGLTRRNLMKSAAAFGAVQLLPGRVLGRPGQPPPSVRPALAAIGIGGVGHGQIQQCRDAGFQVVALCDIDQAYAEKTYRLFPEARRYRDYQDLMSSEGDRIDAVYCATPDHTHALIALAALKARKHCLCVKPLTRTVSESRRLVNAAREAGVMTQMTAAPASTEAGCRTCEMIWGGVVGGIRRVHIWSNRPLWPQGMTRPEGEDPVPDHFDWERWLGPAPRRPYKSHWPQGSLPMAQTNWPHARTDVYHAWNFRGWYDFGTGALGDMGCHHFNIPFRALKLGMPVSVSATSTRVMEETWPLASVVTWDFPAREGMPPVQVNWYDGGLRPPRPSELEPGRELPAEGILYQGDEGILLAHGCSSIPRLIPEERMKKYVLPPKTLARRGGIYPEWFEAIQGGEAPSEDWISCAAPLSELVLLGNVALRIGGGKKLSYDADKVQFPGNETATRLLQADYQNGWTL